MRRWWRLTVSISVSRKARSAAFSANPAPANPRCSTSWPAWKTDARRVRIGGVPVSKLDERELAAFRQKHLGFVFQSYNLLPNLTALENVAMPLMFRGVPKDSANVRRVAYSNESGSAIVSAITRARCREANSSASASPGRL